MTAVGGAVHFAHLSSGYRHVLGKSCCMLMLGYWLLHDSQRVSTDQKLFSPVCLCILSHLPEALVRPGLGRLLTGKFLSVTVGLGQKQIDGVYLMGGNYIIQ